MFTITINRNRSLIVAASPNPVIADLGGRMCGFFDQSAEAVSVVVDGSDAIMAAAALHREDALTNAEYHAYCSACPSPKFTEAVERANVVRQSETCERCVDGVQPSGAHCACTKGTRAFSILMARYR